MPETLTLLSSGALGPHSSELDLMHGYRRLFVLVLSLLVLPETLVSAIVGFFFFFAAGFLGFNWGCSGVVSALLDLDGPIRDAKAALD